MPFAGQPLQGFSGIRSLGDDRFLVLTDNGFGNKANSADAMLMFNILKLDWEAGKVGIEKTTFLSDPNKVVPFPIVTETTTERYLTGADFDIESIQPVGDNLWLGRRIRPLDPRSRRQRRAAAPDLDRCRRRCLPLARQPADELAGPGPGRQGRQHPAFGWL